MGRELAEHLGGERDEEPRWGKVWHCLVGESSEALRVIRNQGNEE